MLLVAFDLHTYCHTWLEFVRPFVPIPHVFVYILYKKLHTKFWLNLETTDNMDGCATA